MFLQFDFYIGVRNADLKHRVRGNMTVRGSRFEFLHRFATLAEIEIRADGALKSNTADTPLDIFARSPIAMDMTMFIGGSGNETFEHGREMIVNCSKRMARMNCRCLFDTIVAKIVITTFEAFMSDAHNIL